MHQLVDLEQEGLASALFCSGGSRGLALTEGCILVYTTMSTALAEKWEAMPELRRRGVKLQLVSALNRIFKHSELIQLKISYLGCLPVIRVPYHTLSVSLGSNDW